MKHDFITRIEKIIEEVRNRTGIDTEALKELLQDEILQVELNEYYYEIFNEGYEEGYDEGYDEGYADCVNGDF